MAFNGSIYIDNGTGAQRKVFDISSCELPVDQRKAIVGLHAFSGNDYLSSFFRKGKTTCFKKMLAKPEYISAFTSLGGAKLLDAQVTQDIERYVCSLYGRGKLESVNEARSSIFWDKYNKDKKIVELSMLPPCNGNLVLHLKRSNYVAYIFQHANDLHLDLDLPSLHGWGETSVQWMDEYFPLTFTMCWLRQMIWKTKRC